MQLNSIPDKFAQRDVSRFGLLGRNLLTVKKDKIKAKQFLLASAFYKLYIDI